MAFHRNLRGKDLHGPTNELVENNTCAAIPTLKVVSLDGMGTAFPQVVVADPSSGNAPFGVVIDEIPKAQSGYICHIGFLFDVNTSAWTSGTLLYCDASGNLSSTPLGSMIAVVVKQGFTDGVIYVQAGFYEQNYGWELDGNEGISASQFLGTTDASPVPIRTNNLPIGIFTPQGRLGWGTQTPARHVEFKSHTSPNSTGVQYESFYLETDSTGFATAYVIPIADPSMVTVQIAVSGRQADGGARCSFKRSGLFYRESSNVQAQGGWQSDFTVKSNNQMNIDYVMTSSALIIRVKPATGNNTRWSGQVVIQEHF